MSIRLKNGQLLEMRVATRDDAEAILAYIEAASAETTFLTFGPGEFEMTVEQEADFLDASARSPNQVYLLGHVDGELITSAHIGASPRERLRHRGEMGMSVRRSHWGQGVGSAVLDYLIDWARENPMLTKLDLQVRVDNTRGIALYRGRGFIEEGVLRDQFRVEDKLYDLIAMGMQV